MAEKEGFEPSMGVKAHTPLAGELLRPLGHLSVDAAYYSVAEKCQQLALLTGYKFNHLIKLAYFMIVLFAYSCCCRALSLACCHCSSKPRLSMALYTKLNNANK